MRHLLLSLLLCCSALVAQHVRLSNLTPHPFDGWKRTTVDVPVGDAFRVDGVLCVAGGTRGRGVRTLDVRCTLAPGGALDLDLSKATPASWERGPLPDVRGLFGGWLTFNDQPMDVVSLQQGGAAWELHARAVAGQFIADVWVEWYPDQPALAVGEAKVTCRSITAPTVVLPQANLAFGDGVVWVPGGSIGAIAPDGTTFADGQARAVPLVLAWPRPGVQWGTFAARAQLGIGAVGIQELIPGGWPALPADFNARAWTGQKWARSVAALHDWGYPAVGISPTSTQTGAQEDQLLVRGECSRAVGAEVIAYLGALKYANRPNHLLEADGSRVIPVNHPQLVIWSGRPHPVAGVSPDRLGRTFNLAPWDTPGEWFGPDREHWLVSTLMGGARLTGSRLLQDELEQQAVQFLFQETVDPRLSTSHSDAARSIGYAGKLVVDLLRNLSDRNLAEQVQGRATARVLQVYLPELAGAVGNVWDARNDDRILNDVNLQARSVAWTQILLAAGGAAQAADLVAAGAAADGSWIGNPVLLAQRVHGKLALAGQAQVATAVAQFQAVAYPRGVMWWQQSLGAWGLDLLCDELGIPQGRAVALAGADAVVAHSWRQLANGRWICWENTGLRADGAPIPDIAQGRGGHRTGWFDSTWMVPALAVILKHRPDDPVARAIWNQVAAGGGSWVPPLR